MICWDRDLSERRGRAPLPRTIPLQSPARSKDIDPQRNMGQDILRFVRADRIRRLRESAGRA